MFNNLRLNLGLGYVMEGRIMPEEEIIRRNLIEVRLEELIRLEIGRWKEVNRRKEKNEVGWKETESNEAVEKRI